MGTVYCGPYADAANSDDHEGSAVRMLLDGSETGVWTYETREFRGYRAVCACGWRGTGVYSPTEQGEESADEEWDRDHLRPLVDAAARRHSVTGDVLVAFTRELRGGLETTVNEAGVEVFTERSRGVLDAVYRLEALLDQVADTAAGGGR